ncbi:hypothetical protein JCM24511_07547 [Saitozyma sp. JCM 24511]|nr:hypothetical protein JCM24511_07547 [Saitozyma sp. JCM 24511]
MSQPVPTDGSATPSGDLTIMESEALQSAAFDAILEQLHNSAQDTRNTSEQREAFGELASAIGLLRDWTAGEGSVEGEVFEGDVNGRIALYIAEVAEAEEEAERAEQAARANGAGSAVGAEQDGPAQQSDGIGRTPLTQAGDIVLDVLCDWTIARHHSERAGASSEGATAVESMSGSGLTTEEREEVEQLTNIFQLLNLENPAEVEQCLSPFGFRFSTSRGFLPLSPDRSDTSDSDVRSVTMNAQPPYSSFSSIDGFHVGTSGETLFGVRMHFGGRTRSSLGSAWNDDPDAEGEAGTDASRQSSRPASSESSPRARHDWPSFGDSSLGGRRRLVHRAVVRRGSPIFMAQGRQDISAFIPHLDILNINATSYADSVGENSWSIGEHTPRPHSPPRPSPHTPPRPHPSGMSGNDSNSNPTSESGSSAQGSSQPSPRAVDRFERRHGLILGGRIRTESPDTYLSNSDVLRRTQLRSAQQRASSILDARSRAVVLESHTISSDADVPQWTARDNAQDEVRNAVSVVQLTRAAELIRRLVRGANGDAESGPETR